MALKADDVPIRRRCDQRWSDLPGSGSVRHCAQCDAPVTNLSAMRVGDARRFLATLEGPRCLAYRYRPGGEIVFASEPGPRRDVRALALAGAAALASACASREPASHEHTPPSVATAEALTIPPDAGALPVPVEPVDVDADVADDPAPSIDCTTYLQLDALGGYGVVVPERCRHRQ